MNNQYRDVSHDLMQAYTGYGLNPGTLTWGNHTLMLTVGNTNYHGIFLSFALVDNPLSQYHGKHIAMMQAVEVDNTSIFVVCEDNHVELRSGAYGTNPCFVTRNGDVIHTISGFQYKFNDNVLNIPLAEGTSQGIAYVASSGEIIWMDQVIGHNSPTYSGVRFTRTYVINDWVFGQSADGPDRVLGYRLTDGKGFTVSNNKTEVQPKGNGSGSNIICATSEPGAFISFESFVPWEPVNNTTKEHILSKLNQIHQQLNQTMIEVDQLWHYVNNNL